MQVHRVDEQPALEVLERDLTDQVVDENLEWFAAVERGSKETTEGDIGPGNLEDVPPPHQQRSRFHLSDRYARCPRTPDERSNAGAHDEAGDQPALLQGPEHTYVGQAFEAAATEDQGERAFGNHGAP
jgi:hypothetical protein